MRSRAPRARHSRAESRDLLRVVAEAFPVLEQSEHQLARTGVGASTESYDTGQERSKIVQPLAFAPLPKRTARRHSCEPCDNLSVTSYRTLRVWKYTALV